MTLHFPRPERDMVTHHSVLVEAARCWRKARDGGQLVQPYLYKVLVSYDCEMLAPVCAHVGEALAALFR